MQTTVKKTLLEMKEKNFLSHEEYEKLYRSTAVTPSFYGLIKLHKVGYPIRPIVSFCASPTYEISKFLSRILTPLTNLSEHKLKNSLDAK